VVVLAGPGTVVVADEGTVVVAPDGPPAAWLPAETVNWHQFPFAGSRASPTGTCWAGKPVDPPPGPVVVADGGTVVVSDWAVADWAVADWAVADWAVADGAIADWAAADWAVADWGSSVVADAGRVTANEAADGDNVVVAELGKVLADAVKVVEPDAGTLAVAAGPADP
jgi:hypothetical protein